MSRAPPTRTQIHINHTHELALAGQTADEVTNTHQSFRLRKTSPWLGGTLRANPPAPRAERARVRICFLTTLTSARKLPGVAGGGRLHLGEVAVMRVF